MTVGASLNTTASAEVTSEVELTFDLKFGGQARLGIGSQSQATSYANVQADLRKSSISGEAGISVAIGGSVEVGVGLASKLVGAKVGIGLDVTMIEFSAKAVSSKADSICLKLAASHEVSGNVHFKAWVDLGLSLRLKLTRELILAKAEWDSWKQYVPNNCANSAESPTNPGDGNNPPDGGSTDGGGSPGGEDNTAQTKQYTQLTGNPDHYWTSASRLCAKATDDTLACWSGRDSGFVTFNPADKWRSYATNENSGCGIKTDGTGWCWGLVPNSDLVATPPGHRDSASNFFVSSPVQIAGTWKSLIPGAKICGIDDKDQLICLRDFTSRVRPTAPYPHVVLPGSWKQLHDITNGFCATKVDDTVWCHGVKTMGTPKLDATDTLLKMPGRWKAFKGNFRQLCGQRFDNSVWCWGILSSNATNPDRIAKPFRLPGFPADYTAANQRACFRSWVGQVTCVGLDSNLNEAVSDVEAVANDRASFVKINGTWESFSALYPCGRKTDGTTWCAETRWNPQTNKTDRSAMRQVPGEWTNTIGAAGYNCGIKSVDNQVYCWGTGTDSLPANPAGYEQPTRVVFP